MRISWFVFGVVVSAASSVSAQNSIKYDTPPKVGQSTQQWLKIQRDGDKASTLPQPLSGPVSANIYQRYEDSFRHPIPEFFTGDDADATVFGQ